MIPSSSHHHPVNGREKIRADLRRDISPWAALCWAYADECVGLATNAPDGHHLYVSNGLAQTGYGERMARGSINAALDAHEDAFAIDGFVWEACGRDPSPYNRIKLAAERKRIIPAVLEIEPLRCLPRLNERGRPQVEYPIGGRREAYLCVVTYAGYDQATAQAMARAHAAFHDLFIHVMAAMVDLVLVKWRVVTA